VPLTSKDIPGGSRQRQVAEFVWVSDEVPENGSTILRTGRDMVRVNVTKAGPVPNTALGRALSWMREHESEPVIIAGPDAEVIVKTYQGG
jgi:hypothetical protein